MDTSLIAQLVQQYGYLAVLVGSLLEGETVLVLAGFAAHRGYLEVGVVMAVAATGGFLGDQAFYWLGRIYGQVLLMRWPRLAERAGTVNALLQGQHGWIIIGVRFMYGLRVAGPVVIGMSEVGPLRFAGFNLIGAILWAMAVTAAGYLFGQALELVLGDVKRYEELAFAVIVGVSLLLWGYHRLAARRHRDRQRR